jgi:antitoxin YefM
MERRRRPPSTPANSLVKKAHEMKQSTRRPVVIHRREGGDLALIGVAELRGLLETVHLLRSSKNAERLLRALARAKGRELQPEPFEKLRRELGLDEFDHD